MLVCTSSAGDAEESGGGDEEGHDLDDEVEADIAGVLDPAGRMRG
jgi:hypothetical protein